MNEVYKALKRFAVDLKKIEQDLNEQDEDWKGITLTLLNIAISGGTNISKNIFGSCQIHAYYHFF